MPIDSKVFTFEIDKNSESGEESDASVVEEAKMDIETQVTETLSHCFYEGDW